MIKLVADLHTHTLASGHAYGTIREMAQAAAQKNLEILGISEHGPGIPGTCHPIHLQNAKEVVPETLYGVRVVHGAEMNVLNDQSIELEDNITHWLDYLIAGIHLLCYKDEGAEKNTDNVIVCMHHPKVRLISHPDDDKTPLDYERLVKAAKETNTALEVNNHSLHYPQRRQNCFENYRTMLKLCKKHGVPIIVSSDAHDPCQVADFEIALDLLEECEFPQELVLNTDAKKLMEFLETGYFPE